MAVQGGSLTRPLLWYGNGPIPFVFDILQKQFHSSYRGQCLDRRIDVNDGDQGAYHSRLIAGKGFSPKSC
jgi:hypothetical protein